MNELEKQQRAAVVREALSCVGTPYHDNARVKGAGLDCLTFLAWSFEAAGLVPHVEIPPYSPQWHLHRNQELYTQGLLRYMREIEGMPQPGDVPVWKFGRCYAHGGIVTQWPRLVHSVKGIGVHESDATIDSLLKFDKGKPRPVKFFSLWGRI
jgi:cell wall-associated NlpC family hydrolase